MEQSTKPLGFENYLSGYSAVLFDGYCSEPVSWGYKILSYLGEELFGELGKSSTLKCIDGFKSSWALITRTLNCDEASEKYGPIENYGKYQRTPGFNLKPL